MQNLAKRYSNKEDCIKNVKFESDPKHPNIKTDTKYALDTEQLEELVISKFSENKKNTEKPKNKYNQINRQRFQNPLYRKCDNKSKLNTLRYMFHKFRSGYYLSIKNNKVVEFTPFYNLDFKNNWYQLLDTSLIPKNKIYPDGSKWMATNSMVHLENRYFSDQKYSIDTFLEVVNMFISVCNKKTVPDIDIFVNVKDFPLLKVDKTEPFHHIYNSKDYPLTTYSYDRYYPVLSFNTSDNFLDIPIPTNHEWWFITGSYFKSRCLNDYLNGAIQLEWSKKKPTAVFRGKATGAGVFIKNNPRLKAARLDKLWSEDINKRGLLDAGITSFPNRYKTYYGDRKVYYSRNRRYVEKMENLVSIKKFMSMAEQSTYKYVLNIPGNSSAYRLSYLLKSGSVILNVSFENKLWFEYLWKPWVHYIPVAEDLSDLETIINWCIKNDKKCQDIVNNAKSFADKYLTEDGVADYIADILNRISANK